MNLRKDVFSTKKKWLSMALLCAISAVSYAQDYTPAEAAAIRANGIEFNSTDPNFHLPQGGCVGTCLYSTMAGANTSGAPSQQFTNVGVGLQGDFFLADEFSVPSADPALRGWVVESINFLGYFSLPTDVPPGSSHTGTNLALVPDNGGAPEDGGASIRPADNAFVDRNGVTASVVGQAINDLDDGDYSISFPTPIYLEPGDTYWVAPQSVGPFDNAPAELGAVWFWNQSSDGEGSEGFFAEDDLGNGALTDCNLAWDIMENCSEVNPPFGTVGSGHATYPNLAFQVNGQALMVGVSLTVPVGNLVTDELGASDSFSVVLNAPPLAGATVSISVVSSDSSEASVSTSALLFDASNWNVPQTVTVIGEFDNMLDGDQAYQILLGPAAVTVGADPEYDGLVIAAVDGINQDAGVMLPVPTISPLGMLFMAMILGFIAIRRIKLA